MRRKARFVGAARPDRKTGRLQNASLHPPPHEVAPRWALCSDCRLESLPTCPEVSQCWSPLRTEDLPAEQPDS